MSHNLFTFPLFNCSWSFYQCKSCQGENPRERRGVRVWGGRHPSALGVVTIPSRLCLTVTYSRSSRRREVPPPSPPSPLPWPAGRAPRSLRPPAPRSWPCPRPLWSRSDSLSCPASPARLGGARIAPCCCGHGVPLCFQKAECPRVVLLRPGVASGRGSLPARLNARSPGGLPLSPPPPGVPMGRRPARSSAPHFPLPRGSRLR